MPDNSNAAISSTIPDWTRERCAHFSWQPGKKLLACIRKYQAIDSSGLNSFMMIRFFNKALCLIRHRFWTVISGADIPINSNIGGGLLIPHPNGIVIHPDAVIGPNCLLMSQVVIGASGNPETDGVPIVGGHVDFGTGAKVLGGIRIHDHAKIGANAVVLEDVGHGKTAVGVPARVL